MRFRPGRFASAPIALAAALAAAGTARAAGGGSSGAEFLRVGMGARAAAMGGSFTGLADDVTAASWNPAGLGQLERVEVSAMHLSYLGDIAYEYLAGAYPVGRWGTVAVSGIYMNVRPFDSTDPLLGGGASGTATDAMAAVSWGGSVKPLLPGSPEYHGLNYGLTVKFVQRSLGGYQPSTGGAVQTFTASTIAADAGVLYRYTPEVTMGAALQHVGGRITFLGDEDDPLPVTFRLGASWRAFRSPWGRGLFLADLIKPVDPDGGTFERSTWFGAGGEVVVRELFAVRLGVRGGPEGPRAVGGAGVTYRGFSLDYAFLPLGSSGFAALGEFGDGHRLGLTFKLGGAGPRLGAPRELAARGLPKGRVALRWKPVPGAAGYHVAMRKSGAEEFRTLTAAPRRAPELVMRGLTGGAEYEFKVIAVDSGGREGPQTTVRHLVADAGEASGRLAAPRRINGTSGAGGRAAVSWSPVAGASGYHVYFNTGETRKWRRATRSPRTTTRVSFKGLKPGTYRFTVLAVDGKGGRSRAGKPVSLKVGD